MAGRISSYLPEHGEYLAARLHHGNIAEAYALYHLLPVEAIRKSVEHSQTTWTGFDRDGNPLAIFGIRGDLLGGVGYPWLVCREDIADHGLMFVRWFRRVLDIFKEQYDELLSLVYDGNEPMLHMLEWAGFSIGEARPYGVDGKLFRAARLTRGDD